MQAYLLKGGRGKMAVPRALRAAIPTGRRVIPRIIHESSAASANCMSSRAVLGLVSSTYCTVCLRRPDLRLPRPDTHLSLSPTNIHE